MAFSLFLGIAIVCHAQIASPTNLELQRVEAYEGYLEEGDQLYIAIYDCTYAANPAGYDISDLFLFRLMNSGTQLEVNTAYPYNGDGTNYGGLGFDNGVASIYLDASTVSTLGMGFGAATNYYIQLTGNPIFTWAAGTPPQINHSVDAWFEEDIPDRLTARMRFIAAQIEVDWEDDLIGGPNGQQTFTNDGEEYFTNSIYNLRIVCPELFSATFIEADFSDKDYISDGYAGGDTTDRAVWGNNYRSQSFTASRDYNIDRVEVKLRALGTPQDVSVYITPAVGGSPNMASILAQGTITGVTDTYRKGVWYECSLEDGADLTAGNNYCIVLASPTSNGTNCANWRINPVGTYAEGNEANSANAGATWTLGNGDYMFITKAEDSYSGSESQKREDRLIGTPFDMTNLATQWGMTRLEMSTAIWVLLSFVFSIACSRWGGTYSIMFLVLAIMQPIGWYAGFVSGTFAWVISVMCGLGVTFQFAWRTS